jgi:hypothetical protein
VLQNHKTPAPVVRARPRTRVRTTGVLNCPARHGGWLFGMSHGVEVTRVCRQAPPVLRRGMVADAWQGSLTTARLGLGRAQVLALR